MHDMISYKEGNTWYYRPYDESKDKPKGDDMKQAEITYTVKNDVATITSYKNVLTYRELIKLIGQEKAWEYVKDGVCFYLVPTHAAPDGVEFIRVGTCEESTTFTIGAHFLMVDMDKIVKNMKIAGARLSEFVHGKTVTVKI